MNDNIIGSETLDDGIQFEATENFLKYACPKTQPQLALKVVKDANGDIVSYEVPKNLNFFYTRQKLADGSIVTILRYKPVKHEIRVEFHALASKLRANGQLPGTHRDKDGVVTGAKLLPLSESGKVKEPPVKITFDSLR